MTGNAKAAPCNGPTTNKEHEITCTSSNTSYDSLEPALSKFKHGVTSFHVMVDELVASMEQEREQLRKERSQLEKDRKQFEEECQRVQHVLTDSEQVTLNVGGYKFTTSVTTLRNAPSPSLFNAMFSGRHKLRTDDSGCYFIDRDGRHFHDILNHLRDGGFNYPVDGTDYKYLLELRAEAEYYGLCNLLNLIDRYPYGLVRVQRAAALNVEDSWMYEDGQDEVVFTVDQECQLLGVGLCGTEGALTVELEVYEVDGEDFSNEICTLQTAAQSFTKADGQMIKMYLSAPAQLQPGKYYMLSALIKGTESYCCECCTAEHCQSATGERQPLGSAWQLSLPQLSLLTSALSWPFIRPGGRPVEGQECLDTVIAGGVKIHFLAWESPNGTNEQRGQFPELYIRVVQ